LIEAVGQLARRQRYTRPWVVTTNDNVDALRFYQRRGFCPVRMYRGAVDRSRTRLKPEIARRAPTGYRCARRSSSPFWQTISCLQAIHRTSGKR
jgi:hypothetical protein